MVGNKISHESNCEIDKFQAMTLNLTAFVINKIYKEKRPTSAYNEMHHLGCRILNKVVSVDTEYA